MRNGSAVEIALEVARGARGGASRGAAQGAQRGRARGGGEFSVSILAILCSEICEKPKAKPIRVSGLAPTIL